ncbi:MAG: 2,3-dihydro-2,3-dihydroxybenzoate dehydrogenase [Pseudomonadota bacterium]
MEFQGKTIWVTGAARGIGHQVAMDFQAQGAKVLGLDRSFDASERPFETHELDLARPDAVASFCAQRLGGGACLDVLVHAAGILRMGRSDELSLSDWHACLDSNVSAAFYLLREVVPVFKRQRSGAIVVIASNAAHVPRLGMAAYCASKAALRSFSQCVALELAAYGVRCNVVSPGTTVTPMLHDMGLDEEDIRRTVLGLPDQYKLGIPLGKPATTQDIAAAVLFLASSRSGHVTMHDLVVDGGATLGA